MTDVKKNQIYAELGGKNRYLRVENVKDEEATCTAGWRVRGNQISWSHRKPVLSVATLTDTVLYRLEQDANE